MLQEEINVVKGFLSNDLVALLVAECNRLPAPYGHTLSAVIGAVGPMLIEFVNKKVDEFHAGQISVAAPAAPAAAAAAISVPQG